MYPQIYKYTNTLTCLPLTCLDLQMEHLHYRMQSRLATVKGILQCQYFRNNAQPHWPPTLKFTWPSLHMHYQGQQAQLATLEGPQIPHLGQWAVVQHSVLQMQTLPSGEAHMSKSREKTLTDKCTLIDKFTHAHTTIYISQTHPKIIAQILVHFQPTVWSFLKCS